MGDTHIYLNHIEALKEQIKREPYEFPKVNTVNKLGFYKRKERKY